MMKPVLIIRHAKTEGPGFLGVFLDQQQIPWQLVKIDEGDKIPPHANAFSGIAMMGGPMSVNDDLPWIAQELDLIRDAIAQDVPLIGHCLGGQLISKALGGVVGGNSVAEVGWHEVLASASPEAKDWFGDVDAFLSFHWHYETFSLPEGATHLLASEYCKNQAFAIGKNIGFQCHIEMTEDLVNTWCKNGSEDLMHWATSPAAQQADVIQHDLTARVNGLNKIASRVYTHWIKGLKK